jgi:hypothetical protein
VGQEPRNGATRGVAPTARAALLHLSSPSIRRSATTLSLGLAPVSTALRTHPQSAIRAGVFRKEDTARCEEMFPKLQRDVSSGGPRCIDCV